MASEYENKERVTENVKLLTKLVNECASDDNMVRLHAAIAELGYLACLHVDRVIGAK